MSTQLRLITKPGAAKSTSSKARAAKTSTPQNATPRPLRGRRVPANRARRSVHWQGQWRLDDQTRNIGKAGVASAREALARAHPDAEYRAAS